MKTKTKLTDEQKLEHVIEFLTTYPLDNNGGYQYDYTWIEDTLVVAILNDEGATEIETYRRKKLLKSYAKVEAFAKQHDCQGDDYELGYDLTEGLSNG